LSSILFFELSRSVSHILFICFVLLSCCSIFNDRCPRLFTATCSLYHISSLLSIPFLKVFSTFFKFFQKFWK